MNKKLIGLLISTIFLGRPASAAPGQPSMSKRLEAQVASEKKQGKCDPQLLNQLGTTYFEEGSFARGRETFNQLISSCKSEENFSELDKILLKKGDTQQSVVDLKVANALTSWAFAEEHFARSFTNAQKLYIRALALLDKRGPNSNERIAGHREMVQFYRRWKKEADAKVQIEELSKMMGKGFPKIVDPNAPRTGDNCPACGRG
ncbi:MAG: hypothetical protein K2Z81_16340 [Cyanobacteria bacterium]|nr:hypothetical protein [Cyanobacteriota bacterium]